MSKHGAVQHEINARLRALPKPERDALVRELERLSMERGFFYYGGRNAPPLPHPIALCPLVFPRELLADALTLARLVARTVSALPTLWLENCRQVRKLFLLHPRTAQWIARYHRPRTVPDDLFIRLDVGITRDPHSGNPSLVLFENNSLALAGVYNHTVGTELLERLVLPTISREEPTPKLTASPNLIDLSADWITQRRNALPVPGGAHGLFILDDPEFLETGSEFRFLQHEFAARGIRTRHGHIGDLANTDQLVWRDLAYQELNLPQTHAAAAPLFRALEDDRMLHGFGAEFVEKGLLECLTNPEYSGWFSADEWATLQRLVPWTRVVWDRITTDPGGATVPLSTYVRDHQRTLLIKPNRDFGGRGVVLGPIISSTEWATAIRQALREPSRWVVQTYIALEPMETIFVQHGAWIDMPCFATFGLFYCHDALGLHGRIGRGRVVNVAQGGALACVFISE